MNYKSH